MATAKRHIAPVALHFSDPADAVQGHFHPAQSHKSRRSVIVTPARSQLAVMEGIGQGRTRVTAIWSHEMVRGGQELLDH